LVAQEPPKDPQREYVERWVAAKQARTESELAGERPQQPPARERAAATDVVTPPPPPPPPPKPSKPGDPLPSEATEYQLRHSSVDEIKAWKRRK
jgi:hypothetical protein